MAGTFMPEFNTPYTISHRNLVRIGDKKCLEENRVPPPLSNFHPEKHLNGRSSLIKHKMTMNYTPLDSSFQCASFESKKF
jgi:hypothetical protein